MARKRSLLTKTIVVCVLAFAAIGAYTFWTHKDVQNTVEKVERAADGAKKAWDK